MAHLETVELHHQAPTHFLLRLTSSASTNQHHNEDDVVGVSSSKKKNNNKNKNDDEESSAAIRVVSLDQKGAGDDELVRNCIFPFLLKQKSMKVIVGYKEDSEQQQQQASSSSAFKFAPASLNLNHLTSDLLSIHDSEVRSILSLLFRKQCIMSLGAVLVAKVTKVISSGSGGGDANKALFLKLGTSGNVQALAPFPVSKEIEGSIAVIKPFGGVMDDEDDMLGGDVVSFEEDVAPNDNNKNKNSGDSDDDDATIKNKNKNKKSKKSAAKLVDIGDSVSARILYVASNNNAIVACSVSEKIVNRAPMNRNELVSSFTSSPTSVIGAGKSVTATILLHCSSEEAFGVNSHLAVGEVITNSSNAAAVDGDLSQPESSVLVYIRMGPLSKAAQLREKYPARSQVQVVLQFVPNDSMLDALPFCVGQIQTDVKPFLRVAGAIEQHLPLIPRQCVASATSNKHHTISNIFKPLSGIKFQQFCDPLFVDAKQQQKEKENDQDDVDEHGNSKSRIRRRELEEAIDAYERQGEVVPTTADGFRKLLLSSPQSSYIWIRYMAFLISVSKIDEAKDIAEQALSTINARDTGSERLNIFTAYMNLENLHGTAESLSAVFNRALSHSDSPLSVYERLAHIFRATKKKDQLLQLCRTMTSKFATESKVWELLCFAYIDQEKREALRRTIRQIQAHTSLKMTDKTLILQHVAVHEYKLNNPTHGRALFETLVSQKAKRSDVWNVFLDQEISMLTRGDQSTNIMSVRKLFQRASSVQLPPRAMQQLMSRFLKFEQQHGTSADVERVKEAAQKYVQERLAAASSANNDIDTSVPAGFSNGAGSHKKFNDDDDDDDQQAEGTNLLEDTTNELLGGNDNEDAADGGVYDQL